MLFNPDKRDNFLHISSFQRDILLDYQEFFRDFEVYRQIAVALKGDDGYKVLMSFLDLEELEAVSIDIIQQTDDHEIALAMDNLVDLIWRLEQKICPEIEFDEVALDAAVNAKYRNERGIESDKSTINWKPAPFYPDTDSETIYTFLVELSPEIWRRIAIKADSTLLEFHEAIFIAFDRYDQHMFSFFMPVADIEVPGLSSIIRESVEFTHPSCYQYSPDGTQLYDCSNIRLSQLGLSPKKKWWYLFDFGDEWLHKITTLSVSDKPEQTRSYPAIIELYGESPNQYPV